MTLVVISTVLVDVSRLSEISSDKRFIGIPFYYKKSTGNLANFIMSAGVGGAVFAGTLETRMFRSSSTSAQATCEQKLKMPTIGQIRIPKRKKEKIQFGHPIQIAWLIWIGFQDVTQTCQKIPFELRYISKSYPLCEKGINNKHLVNKHSRFSAFHVWGSLE